MASWVQADSSFCLFSLIYQAKTDKCKHLTEHPPYLGALGGWMCSIFYPHMVDQCIILTGLSFQPFLLGLILFLLSQPHLKQTFPPGCLRAGVTVDDGCKLL